MFFKKLFFYWISLARIPGEIMGAKKAVNPKLFGPGAIRFVLYNGTYNHQQNELTIKGLMAWKVIWVI